MPDMLQIGVGLVPLVSLYVAKRASSDTVRAKAILAAIASGFVYLLWYAPAVLINAKAIDFRTAQLGLILRDFFASRMENTAAGLFWTILLAVNLVIAATRTRIPELHATRKWVTVMFWIVTAYITWEALSVVGNAALYGLLIPLTTTILNWGYEIVDKLI